MVKAKLAVLVSGNGTNLQAMINAIQFGLLQAEIAVVVSTRPHAYALERAAQVGIPTVVVARKSYPNNEAYSEALLEVLEPYAPDLILLAGFMSVLSDAFVSHYTGRIMNTHPALIPAFCGPGFYGDRVHQAVLDYGAKVSGASIIFVEPGVDTGPIILQEAVPVYDTDDVDSLAQRVLEVEHRLYVRAVEYFLAGRLEVRGRRVYITPVEGGEA
ncbi:MAG TPA: phosphoribosylglycinamide formyltransferase [Firmicutes bacterium]|nr:phosphoribosylglycinamide formyltransferase [Bacillota bacterium]